jgi:hypothetical protein
MSTVDLFISFAPPFLSSSSHSFRNANKLLDMIYLSKKSAALKQLKEERAHRNEARAVARAKESPSSDVDPQADEGASSVSAQSEVSAEESSEPSPDLDLSPWDVLPEYPVARSIRCIKDPRSKTLRVFVYDYADGTQRASARRGNQPRFALRDGAIGPRMCDSDWLEIAKLSSFVKPDEPPLVARSDGFHRLAPVPSNFGPNANSWIWAAGAFDEVTDKLALVGRQSAVMATPKAA